ncbi:type I 3-dehydroquinate dehydratase [Candidatus Peregrinibacteria bacterium]|nr:type I 3-dehydroquinate dehydratase [Candidatus Peregrinibacteria bacterium]
MRICIPIYAKSVKEAEKQVKKTLKMVRQKPEILFEVWLDRLMRPDFEANFKKLIKFCKASVIAVCRGKIERGNFKGGERERIEILKNAVLAGAKLIDCGIQTDKTLVGDLKKVCKKHGAKLIISKHIWDGTPELKDLLKIFKSAKALGADIVKIATYAKKWSDNAVLFELVSRISQKGGKIIAIGMGKRGRISRIGCPLLGSYLTYVALDEKSRTADGQLTLREIKALNL